MNWIPDELCTKHGCKENLHYCGRPAGYCKPLPHEFHIGDRLLIEFTDSVITNAYEVEVIELTDTHVKLTRTSSSCHGLTPHSCCSMELGISHSRE